MTELARAKNEHDDCLTPHHFIKPLSKRRQNMAVLKCCYGKQDPNKKCQ